MKTMKLLFLMPLLLWANATLVNLPADSWYTVNNSAMRPVCDPSVSAYECQSVQSAWCGGAYDPVGRRMIIWGGGHGDSDDNSVYVFNIAALAWQRFINSTGSYASQDPLPNGDPAARHTYDGLAFITHANRLFAYGGSQAGNGYGTSVTWTLDMAARDWFNMQPAGSHGPTTDCCNFSGEYDPVSKLVFMHDPNNLYSYDYDNNRWTIVLSQSEKWSAHKGVVDTKRRLYFTIGSGELLVYDIAGRTNVTSQWTAANNSSATGGGYAAAAYDSKADKIVVWRGGGPWVLDLASKTWTRKSGTGAPGSGLSNGTFGRWRYIAEDNVFILVNGVDQNVRFYKHTAGGGATGTEAKPETEEKGSIYVSPNPFKSRAIITISNKLRVTSYELHIFDITGKELETRNSKLETSNTLIWNASGLPAGVYLAKVTAGGRTFSKRIFLVK